MLKELAGAPITCTYLRFRLGTHLLQVELGRWQDRRRRHQRLCRRCRMHAIAQFVDDERHLVFECPDLERFRAARKHLFNMSVGENMFAFITQTDQRGVLRYVLDCMRHIQEHQT